MKNLKFFAISMGMVIIANAVMAPAQQQAGTASAEPISAPISQLDNTQASLAVPELIPTWQRLDFATLPPPRVGASLTLNPINKIALLFGGSNSTAGELNDLWLTNGISWMQFYTPHSPEPRARACLAYDEERHQAVLFGGIGGGAYLGDTWLFNGVDWVQQQPLASPSPRTAASMAHDPERKVSILFGGLVDTGEFDQAVNEMWLWDGESWQQQFPATLPPARWGASMVYDHAHKSILLFGGTPGGGFLEDTWLWNGSIWVEQRPAHHPAGRADFGMAYDEDRQKVILFGGQADPAVNTTETWTWDGQDWTLLPARQAPPEELAYGAQLVYLPGLQAVMLYNDLREKTLLPDDTFIFTETSDVWVLTYRYLVFLPIIHGE